MRAVEASAKTREEAIQIALKELGIEMYEVDKIEILDEGSKGIFGFGARPVKVRLVAENMPDLPVRKAERSEEPRASRDARNERPSERGGDRGGDRGRGDRNDNRGERNRDQEKPREAREPRGERPQGERKQGDRPQGDRPQGDRPQGDRPQGDRNRNDRGPRAERGGEGGGGGERPARPQGEGDRGRGGDRPRNERNDRGGRDRDRGGRDRNDRGPRNDRGGGRGDNAQRSLIQKGDSEFGYDPGDGEPHEGSLAAVAAAAAGSVNAERAPREERPPRAPRPPREPREPRPERAPRAAREDGDSDPGDATPEELASQHEQSRDAEEASFAPLTDAQGDEASSFMSELIQKMGITAGVQFTRIEDGGARLNVESEDGAILIGRKGRTLSALQYVVNRIISRGDTAENTERLIVDVGGYVDRRRESLEDMARNLAEKAKGTGRNMRLKPMSPQERRIIHVTLQGDEEVRTFSLGESLYRSVVISPKNASPEAPSRGPRGGRSRGHRGGRGRGGQRRDRFEVDAGQFGD